MQEILTNRSVSRDPWICAFQLVQCIFITKHSASQCGLSVCIRVVNWWRYARCCMTRYSAANVHVHAITSKRNARNLLVRPAFPIDLSTSTLYLANVYARVHVCECLCKCFHVYTKNSTRATLWVAYFMKYASVQLLSVISVSMRFASFRTDIGTMNFLAGSFIIEVPVSIKIFVYENFWKQWIFQKHYFVMLNYHFTSFLSIFEPFILSDFSPFPHKIKLMVVTILILYYCLIF